MAFELDQVEITGNSKFPSTDSEVDQLERTLWFSVPEGYRQYIQVLGEGVLGSEIRVYPPWKILKDVEMHRVMMRDYWFWYEGPIPQSRAIESIPIGDTTNGDAFVVHPGRPAEIFVLPHGEDNSEQVKGNLNDLIDWFITGFEDQENRVPFTFQPYDSRTFPNHGTESEFDFLGNEARTELRELVGKGLNWVTQHRIEAWAKRRLLAMISDSEEGYRDVHAVRPGSSGISFSNDGFFMYFETLDPEGERTGRLKFSAYEGGYGIERNPSF